MLALALTPSRPVAAFPGLTDLVTNHSGKFGGCRRVVESKETDPFGFAGPEPVSAPSLAPRRRSQVAPGSGDGSED